MNKPEVELALLAPCEHADDYRGKLNETIARVNFFTDRYNGVELPAYDPVTDWAKANSLGHMARAIQEAAYNAANPNAKIATKEMDAIELYASANGLSHMTRSVQEAAWAADTGNTIPREPARQE